MLFLKMCENLFKNRCYLQGEITIRMVDYDI